MSTVDSALDVLRALTRALHNQFPVLETRDEKHVLGACEDGFTDFVTHALQGKPLIENKPDDEFLKNVPRYSSLPHDTFPDYVRGFFEVMQGYCARVLQVKCRIPIKSLDEFRQVYPYLNILTVKNTPTNEYDCTMSLCDYRLALAATAEVILRAVGSRGVNLATTPSSHSPIAQTTPKH